jgi:phenylalanyl-tRNA synthetase alpha chain
MLGAGMIHPNILRGFGYDPDKISGFAFGMGLDRIVMDKYKISDIRSLYNGDIKYS